MFAMLLRVCWPMMAAVEVSIASRFVPPSPDIGGTAEYCARVCLAALELSKLSCLSPVNQCIFALRASRSVSRQ